MHPSNILAVWKPNDAQMNAPSSAISLSIERWHCPYGRIRTLRARAGINRIRVSTAIASSFSV
ncbi:hypothetical protein CUR178_06856 [Leishmania enriettii]|uniref:Uncharacterized protein n=1 Tax=Leishmania enriettii TaxID=5663 RepID=A0A836KQJ0_LEIEN|nr:hypothetical protein CUR178_06856 [Leishmania enriettii]